MKAYMSSARRTNSRHMTCLQGAVPSYQLFVSPPWRVAGSAGIKDVQRQYNKNTTIRKYRGLMPPPCTSHFKSTSKVDRRTLATNTIIKTATQNRNETLLH